MIIKSPFTASRIVQILSDEVDSFPSFFRSLISLNSHFYIGTSPVCGTIGDHEFELRNRKGHLYSYRAFCTIREKKGVKSALDSLNFL